MLLICNFNKMRENFIDCPFYLDELKVHSIYRSLNPSYFFITFIKDNVACNGIVISTLNNHFANYVARCSTVWYPDFELMKDLLFQATKVIGEFSEEDRHRLLESTEEIIEFGEYEFNEDGEYTYDSFGNCTYKKKVFKVVVDNKNR